MKKRLDLLAHGVRFMMRSGVAAGIPPIVQLEPSNVCNLGCLTCPTGAGLMKRAPFAMPFYTYRNVIDQIKDHALLLVFWSWGEPFMNKDACRMIRYAKDCGLFVHSSTNGHFFTVKEQARALIDSGLDSLIVAVDGLDQQTYEKYRKRGNFKHVIKSIENLISERSKAGARHPLLTFRFIVMKHNEHQLEGVRDFAKDLGVDVVTFRSAVIRRKGVDLENSLAPKTPRFRRFINNSGPLAVSMIKAEKNYCHRPYANLTILSNGDIVLCENDFDATLPLGNVAKKSILEILSSDQSRQLYKEFCFDLNSFSFCRECELRDTKHTTANVQTIFLNSELHDNNKNNSRKLSLYSMDIEGETA